MKKGIVSLLGGIGILLFVLIGNSRGSMLDPGAMGGRASGMGGAVVANADDLMSAFYFNPAGLTEIGGTNLAIGSTFSDLRVRYESPQGYDQENSFDPFVPFLGWATDSFGPTIVGIGMYSTMGVGFEFKEDPAHGIDGDIVSKSGVMFLAPTIAYKVNPKLSMGVELNIGYGKSEMDQPTPGGYLEMEADGLGYGVSVGVLYKLSPSLNLGLCWRSPMHTSQEGDARLGGIKHDLDLDVYWPQMLSFGMGYKFTPDLLLAFSLKWSDWSYFDKSKVSFNNAESPFAKDTRDGWRLNVGAEYRVNSRLTLHAGYIYDWYSFQSEWISPMLMDTSFYELRTGATIEFEKIQINFNYVYTFFTFRNVSESFVGYPGRYGGYMPAIGFEVSYRF